MCHLYPTNPSQSPTAYQWAAIPTSSAPASQKCLLEPNSESKREREIKIRDGIIKDVPQEYGVWKKGLKTESA